MDGFEGKTERARYDYPFAEPPAPGAVLEIASGVKWVRMPLPFSLKWINLWLLEDGDGWTVVDTGIPNSETKAHWRTIFENELGGRPVKRIIVTHMHPDHIGLAGWMSRKYQAELWITRLEYITCRTLVADTGREAPEAGVKFYRAAGWGQQELDRYVDKFGGFGRSVSQLPDAFHRISDNDVITIGGRAWHVVTGCGHSPDHACLYAPDINVFISGDQILPRISSNVSVFPTEPAADPLKDWLDSCRKLKAAIPADVMVLPSHNEPFYGAHKRLDALIEGHEVGMRRLLSRLEEPKRVVDLFVALFARAIEPDSLGMATGETVAHLNCLKGRGLIVSEQDAGTTLYRRAS
ncbi:MAG: MBL fold metallo-hydrolase [Rhodobacterales bacterium 12-64-8]|nr:MAG: MBL fold metallo-hydrolase [Rhodobacterales bacterium 12-64-8]OYX46725.1 MAG: MBL fold metallo-hydrolase [Alphaproteobacteria bacterium 32-64-14]